MRHLAPAPHRLVAPEIKHLHQEPLRNIMRRALCIASLAAGLAPRLAITTRRSPRAPHLQAEVWDATDDTATLKRGARRSGPRSGGSAPSWSERCVVPRRCAPPATSTTSRAATSRTGVAPRRRRAARDRGTFRRRPAWRRCPRTRPGLLINDADRCRPRSNLLARRPPWASGRGRPAVAPR